MIPRSVITGRIRAALQSRALVALTGPRQCGKTTVARGFLLPEDSPNYFDLEDPFARARLDEPRTALESLRGLVVLDEIQRRPDLFPLLRELADRPGQPAQFLVLASTSGTLLRQDLASLADQMQRIDIGGLTLAEAGAEQADVLWQRGALPRAFLAGSDADSLAWRKQFIQNFL